MVTLVTKHFLYTPKVWIVNDCLPFFKILLLINFKISFKIYLSHDIFVGCFPFSELHLSNVIYTDVPMNRFAVFRGEFF